MTATDNRIRVAGTLLAAIIFGEVVALGVDGPFLATIAAAVELVGDPSEDGGLDGIRPVGGKGGKGGGAHGVSVSIAVARIRDRMRERRLRTVPCVTPSEAAAAS